MKRAYILNLILVSLITISFIPALAVIEDNDSSLDTLCKDVDIIHYDKQIICDLAYHGIFYNCDKEDISLQPIILYLERQEKSPPQSSADASVV